jgi:hypothetical protein
MSIIHGLSVNAIKFFHEEPAALAVYWIYLARRNDENVAWSGLRRLHDDTKYARNTVMMARRWLVDHGLLELDPNYIKPEWRKKDPDEIEQLRAGDNNEYYRVKSTLYVKGKAYPMLYVPSVHSRNDLTSDIQGGVSPDETGVSHDVRQGGVSPDETELSTPNQLKKTTAKSAVPTTPAVNVPVATKKQSKPNPWYDAIHAVWGYNGDMNGAMFKMLQGKATAPAWKVGNLPRENALTDPAQLLTWAAWYRKTELGDNPKLSMLEERLKIQSSIIGWQIAGCPDVDTPAQPDTVVSDFPIPDDVWDLWLHTKNTGELTEAKFAHRRAGGVWDDAAEVAWLRAYKAEHEAQ